jgi:hypothetical protein
VASGHALPSPKGAAVGHVGSLWASGDASFTLTLSDELHMETLTLKPGQRWTATVHGKLEIVRMVDALRFRFEHWVCKVESTGHLFLIAESALDELLSEPSDDVHETS